MNSQRNRHPRSTLDSTISQFSALNGDLVRFETGWYVTHSGLLRLAHRKKCAGVLVEADVRLCEPARNRWVFRATVFPTVVSKGFVGYGDADSTNISPNMLGCELRIAETRAVNRALRKAYGIGLCSIEELGSLPPTPTNGTAEKQSKPAPLLEVVSQIPLRDQLRQLIRQHQLDPALVKQYALEHCEVKSLRQATREQVASFVKLLAERVAADREALVAELQRLVINNRKDENQQKEAA